MVDIAEANKNTTPDEFTPYQLACIETCILNYNGRHPTGRMFEGKTALETFERIKAFIKKRLDETGNPE